MASRSAPDELEVVRDFINTYDVEDDEEALTDLEAVEAWFVTHGLVAVSDRAGEAQVVTEVRAVREAFRRLLDRGHGGGEDADAFGVLTHAAERTGLAVRFEPTGVGLAPTAAGLRGGLGVLLARAFEAMRDGSWERLKLCERHTCRWAFYDHSRNRSGKWCSMEVCGNRTKVETYRERHGS